MTDTFLTPDEIRAITKRVVHKSQAKELLALKLKFRTRSNGTHVVLRSHVIAELGGVPDIDDAVSKQEPNWLGMSSAT